MGAKDFDFLVGSWKLLNRKKTDGVWEEFPATVWAEKLLDGRVVTERYEAVFPDGQIVKGLAIIALDPGTGDWHHAWVDNRWPPDFTPSIGRFEDGAGDFYQIVNDTNGNPLHVKSRWDNLTADAVRWHQAFSTDEGATWDINWIMEYTRS